MWLRADRLHNNPPRIRRGAAKHRKLVSSKERSKLGKKLMIAYTLRTERGHLVGVFYNKGDRPKISRDVRNLKSLLKIPW